MPHLSVFVDLSAAIAEALLNGLWQGALLTAVVAMPMASAKRLNAATRYAVWCAVLVTVAVLPLVSGRLPTVPAPVPKGVERVVPASAVAGAPAAVSIAAPVEAPSAPAPSDSDWQLPQVPDSWPVGLVGIWLSFAGYRLAGVLNSLRALQRLKARSMPLQSAYREALEPWLATTPRPVRLCSARDVPVPVAVGLFNPTVILPEALLAQLSDGELEQIVLHELAHLRRWDDWTNLVQKLIEAIFFFHPAVLWIARRLDTEREIACDDAVIAVTGKPLPYAACLARLIELTRASGTSRLQPGVLSGTSQIRRRVEMLLKRDRNTRPRLSSPILAAAAVLLSASAFAVQMVPVVLVPRSEAALDFEADLLVDLGLDSGAFAADFERARQELERAEQRREAEYARLELEHTRHEAEYARMEAEFERMAKRAVAERTAPKVARRGEDPIEIPVPDDEEEALREFSGVVLATETLEEAIPSPQEVLAAIASMPSASDRARALGAYAEGEAKNAAPLTPAFFRLIEGLPADDDRRRVLSTVLERSDLEESVLLRVLRSVQSLTADSSKRRVLVEVLHLPPPESEAIVAGVLQGIDTLASSGDRRRVLGELLDLPPSESVTRGALRAVHGIAASGDKANVLLKAAALPLGEAGLAAFFDAYAGVSSSSDKRRVLSRLLEHQGGGYRPVILGILEAMQSIPSSDDRARLLLRMAPQVATTHDPTLLAAFYRACDSIPSATDRRRVLTRLGRLAVEQL
ncbi:M56 family metallopeptidase [Gloeobacter violaceus]|nr:M56 family metallopeptidase [Gloeobacter violaceus]